LSAYVSGWNRSKVACPVVKILQKFCSRRFAPCPVVIKCTLLERETHSKNQVCVQRNGNLYQSRFENLELRNSSSCFLSAGNIHGRSSVLGASLCLAVSVLVGCGGGVGPKETPAPKAVNVSVSGLTVTKVRTAGNGIIVLEERLTSLFEDGPQRTLAILRSDGQPVQSYVPPAGWSLVDFVVHPSGDISAVLTTAQQVRIVRLDSRGSLQSEQPFLDSAATTDAYFNFGGGITDDNALQPALMHDAARLVPLGESVVLVLRTGRNAIVAYRLDLDANGEYQRAWRTLIEPGSSIFFLGITSGSFDVFSQLKNHVSIFVDLDADGTLAIGTVNAPMFNFTFRGHTEYFSEPITASNGMLLTRVASADGRRLGSTVIDTHERAELHGLRAVPRGFMLMGRVLSELRSDGTGWNAFTAFVHSDGTPGPYSVVDVDRGDVFFDVAALSSGRYLALGTTGYVQNPTGESISEAAQPLLVRLNSDGSLAENLGYTGGGRHNQLTTVAPLNGHWLLGGMVNGPGTHSGDAQRDLIVSDGFVREASNLSVE
jgi:hypothetical protein